MTITSTSVAENLDIKSDVKVGLEEVVYGLQVVAGMRSSELSPYSGLHCWNWTKEDINGTMRLIFHSIGDEYYIVSGYITASVSDIKFLAHGTAIVIDDKIEFALNAVEDMRSSENATFNTFSQSVKPMKISKNLKRGFTNQNLTYYFFNILIWRTNMKNKYITILLIVIICAVVIVLVNFFYFDNSTDQFVEIKTQYTTINPMPNKLYLTNFALDNNGNTYASKGNRLYKVEDKAKTIIMVNQFSNIINAVHIMNNDFILVATDDDWWDPQKPCRIYISQNNGSSFNIIKIMEKQSALWWSISSDKKGNIYIGEYGPKDEKTPKNLWKSKDYGETWKVIFETPKRKGHHIHRVAVDPLTDNLWVTYGDDLKGIYMSQNGGDNWNKIHKSQPTSIAFTSEAIYFGGDNEYGIIRRYDRKSKKIEKVLNASELGPYGGSIYDMGVGRNGLIYAPLLKYEGQDHYATLWVGKDNIWRLIMIVESKRGKCSGMSSISDIDKYGIIYTQGFIIEENF